MLKGIGSFLFFHSKISLGTQLKRLLKTLQKRVHNMFCNNISKYSYVVAPVIWTTIDDSGKNIIITLNIPLFLFLSTLWH